MILDFVSFDGGFIRSKIGFLFLFPMLRALENLALLFVTKNFFPKVKMENNYLSTNSKKVL